MQTNSEVQFLIDQRFYVLPVADKQARLKDWPNKSSRDATIIQRWARRYTLAVHCGRTGVAIVDLDVHKANGKQIGQQSWDAWIQTHTCPSTLISTTPTGGKHIWYRVPSGWMGRNSVKGLAPGIDIRAGNGYVVVPPAPGRAWQNRLEIADAPQWFLDAAEARPEPQRVQVDLSNAVYQMGTTKYGEGALRNILQRFSIVPEGSRNNSLNLAALQIGQLVVANHLPRQSLDDLIAVAMAKGLSWNEASKTATNGFTYGAEHPDPRMPKPAWGGGDFAGKYVSRSGGGAS